MNSLIIYEAVAQCTLLKLGKSSGHTMKGLFYVFLRKSISLNALKCCTEVKEIVADSHNKAKFVS